MSGALQSFAPVGGRGEGKGKEEELEAAELALGAADHRGRTRFSTARRDEGTGIDEAGAERAYHHFARVGGPELEAGELALRRVEASVKRAYDGMCLDLETLDPKRRIQRADSWASWARIASSQGPLGGRAESQWRKEPAYKQARLEELERGGREGGGVGEEEEGWEERLDWEVWEEEFEKKDLKAEFLERKATVLHELEVVGQLSRKVSEVRRVADEALAAAAARINAMP